MEPAPPSILKCPYCEALYTRGNWASGNNFGATLWSDGVMTDGMLGYSHDPVVLCNVCQKFFASRKAYTENKWGFALPKDKTFHHTRPISLRDCIKLLDDKGIQLALGDKSTLIFSESESKKLDENQERLEALMWGEYQIRHMIWQKLNDEIREGGYDGLSKEYSTLLLDNAKALLPILPMDQVEYDQTFFIWKAELHRNLGEFVKSFNSLRQITDRSLLKSKRKMIFLNLMRNRKLVQLWADKRGFSTKIKLWWCWIW